MTGNLLIADSANNRVRMIDANGTITTIAGAGKAGAAADGALATQTNISNPDLAASGSARP